MTLYTRHETACIIADLLGDTCACNYSGNDEWLPYHCDFAKTVCPNVVGVACWEQYLKHIDKKAGEAGMDRKEAIERIQEVMTIIKTQHMCKDMAMYVRNAESQRQVSRNDIIYKTRNSLYYC